MLRNLIVLPDGTEIFSGVVGTNAIKSVSITTAVNEQTELTIGSVCSSMVDATIITPYGGLGIDAGTEITLYKVDDTGARHLAGLYTLEKPTRPTANTYKITAYDRISWLDRDLTQWLAGLDGWPYTLLEFSRMVCEVCGLTLINDTVPNAEYQISQFSADGITGRKLMQWCGEVCARFLRATPTGDVEFAWYQDRALVQIAPTQSAAAQPKTSSIITDDGNGNVSISSAQINVTDDGGGNVVVSSAILDVTDDGLGNVTVVVTADAKKVAYFGGSLSYEDYRVAPIEKVQIRMTDNDVGVVFPDAEGEANTYIISGNYLMATASTDALLPVAQEIYEQIKDVTYTPCRVSVPANLEIVAGDIITITDINGITIHTYVMQKSQKGQRDTLECTGSHRRDTSTVRNNETYKAISGRVLEIVKQVEGLSIKNADTEGRMSQLEMTVDGVNTRVSSQVEEMGRLRDDLTMIQQNADSISIRIQNIIDDGVTKVVTGKGSEFGDDGMHISAPDSEMSNVLDETGMMVSNSEEMVLQANKDGVNALNVTIRQYLIIPGSRFERYVDGAGEEYTASYPL